MRVVRALGRLTSRRHLLVVVALALVLAGGLGAASASLALAERTAGAYPAYLDRADVAELVVNPGLATREAEDLIRSTPGVRRVTTDSLLTASIGGPRAADRGTVDEDFLQTRLSLDGRYVVQDRPVVRDGRMLGRGRELFLDVEAAERLDLAVGDEVPLTFWSDPSLTGGPEPEPLGTVRAVRVVGIGTFPDEVQPDELYPRLRMLVSPAVGQRFDCRFAVPAPDDPRPLGELAAEIVPPGCATTYTFASVAVEGGSPGATRVADEIAQRLEAANRDLPPSMREADVGYVLFPAFRAQDEDRVRESLAPVVTSLRAFALGAGLATVAVVLLLVTRHVRRRDDEAAVWRGLGADRASRAAALALVPAAATVLGTLGALLVAAAASSTGPLATVAVLETDPGPSLPASLVAATIAAAAVVLAGVGAVTWRQVTRPAPPPRAGRWGQVPGPPALVLGVRAALSGRTAVPLLAGAVVAVTAVVATVVFSMSLVRFLDEPERFGWPWELAALVNAGYGPIDGDAVAASLARDDVEGWGVAAINPSLTVDGATVPFLAARQGFDEAAAALPVLEGRHPTGTGEIALGATTADSLGVRVGERVDVGTPYGDRTAEVTGLVVLPTVGPLENDRTSLGTGALLPAPFFEAALGDAPAQLGADPVALADSNGAFVVVDLVDGADAAAMLDDVAEEVPGWSAQPFPPVTFTDPVRPPAVIDAAAMRGVPIALATVFALAMAAALVAGIAAGTRARRHELALLRALGAARRSVRASVRWHALAVVAVALALGLPLGVAAGRVSYRAFADELGVVPAPVVAWPVLVALVLAVVALALVAAAGPARSALSARVLVAELRAPGGPERAPR